LEGYSCPQTYGTMESFLEVMDQNKDLTVILIDIGLPGISGIEGIQIIKKNYPDIDILMFTIYNDPDKIFRSLQAGASGYILKNTPLHEMKDAVDLLSKGGAPMSPEIAKKVIEYFNKQPVKTNEKSNVSLSPQEGEVVNGLVDGLSYKMIADRMDLSIETVRSYIKNIYKKLHVHSKSEVVAKYLKGEI
ncbi:MAG: response regulator transcription factor, partial [Calditrichaeota bacterium]|nr:response regulator transcription factor [Calditrichota bacterium]